MVNNLTPIPGAQTLLHHSEEVVRARQWRVRTTHTSTGCWDINRLAFLHNHQEQTGTPCSSGHAYPHDTQLYGAQHAFENIPRFWGGRPNAHGNFHLGIAHAEALPVNRIVLDQRNPKHCATEIDIQSSEDGENWRTLITVSDLKPGSNDILLFFSEASTPEAPPTMSLSMKNHHDHLFDILVSFTDIMERHGLTYMLALGTLLDAYRAQDLLTHDFDIDVIILQDESDRIARVLERELPDGYTLVNNFSWFGIIDEIHHRVHLDILQYEFVNGYFWLSMERRKNTSWRERLKEKGNRHHFLAKYSAHDILPLSKMPLRNRQFFAPARPHRVLVAQYGSLGQLNGDSHLIEMYASVHQNNVAELASLIRCLYPVQDRLNGVIEKYSKELAMKLRSILNAFGYHVTSDGKHEIAIELDGVDAFIHVLLRLLDQGIVPRYCVENQVYFEAQGEYAIVQVKDQSI